MRKKHFLIIPLVFVLNSTVLSQTSPVVPTKFPTDFGTFTFPIGSKIIIELKEMDSARFEYRVLSIEKIEEFYSFRKGEDLFAKNRVENTVELFFMGAYYNEGKED